MSFKKKEEIELNGQKNLFSKALERAVYREAFIGAVAERFRHRSREQKVPSSSSCLGISV